MFLAPLHAARAIPALLENISPFTNAPQLVVAALRALTDIANAAVLANPSSPLDIESLADQVLSPQHMESFSTMLSYSTSDHLRQSQTTLVAGLISRLCQEERHQHSLTIAGILDALATRLASFAVARGHVIPGADTAARKDGLFEAFPEPAAYGTNITPIFEAIAAILGDSKYRAYRLINSPSILAVFPSIKFHLGIEIPEIRQDLDYATLGSSWEKSLTAMEFLLPSAIPISLSRNPPTPQQSSIPQSGLQESRSSSRTSLNMLSSSTVWDSSRFRAPSDGEYEDVESPLIPWLVFLVRSSNKYERLFAASILASLMKAGLGSKGLRETSLGLLVVPPLVEMISKNDKDVSDVDEVNDVLKRTILERAPAVLARLIVDSEYLQKAAYDCDAVKVLSKLLKHAYHPVEDVSQPRYWSPNPDTGMDIENSAPLAQLGPEGQNGLLIHRLKVRESTLKAIAALAGAKEDYRKAFVSEDIVSYVVESLSEFPRKPRSAKERTDKSNDDGTRDGATAEYGANPASVIIAGCHVVRMLSRSVSILRTSLVDHGVAQPIHKFMKHSDVNVQIAATAAMINLVIEVSPVREVSWSRVHLATSNS